MPTTIVAPDYSGGSLLNLVAELERRLTGASPSPGLHPDLAARVPDADSYVLVVLDGLGADQLAASPITALTEDLVGVIDAPFPTTTTVSLATIATGLAPSQHGLIGYQLHLPETIDPSDERQASVVNTIKWTRLWGAAIDIDTAAFLPTPNLWERLRAGGIEPITVQPGNFAASSLSSVLYRGCRFEGVYTVPELIEATVDLAAVAGRLVVTYLPQIDFAAHVAGQESQEYAGALRLVDGVWSSLSQRLPAGVALVGTADHGHLDFPKERQFALPLGAQKGLVLYGDSRAMFVKGDGSVLADMAPATWLPLSEVVRWWGPEPVHHTFGQRAPDGVLLADDDHVILHRHSDTRMTGHHGAMTAGERLIPLLVRGPHGVAKTP